MTASTTAGTGARRAHRRAVAARLALLFDQHASMVLGLCRLLLRDHHEAEDAAQQTFVSAYRSLLRGTEPRDAAPWLAAIARNECRARIRKRMRAPVALEAEVGEQFPDPSDVADQAERRAELAALTAAIADLPSRQREAVALRDFLGLSYEEVASTLSVSVPVVESLLFRARRRLRDTVRTVPRYAAGFVGIPLALKAAFTRDGDIDTAAVGAAGAAGAAVAAMIAKLVSAPFAAKATTAVTVVAVATAGPQLGGMFKGAPPAGAPPPAAAPAGEPAPPSSGEPAPAVGPQKTFDDPPAGGEGGGDGAPAQAPGSSTPPVADASAAETEVAGEPERTVAPGSEEKGEKGDTTEQDAQAPAPEPAADPVREIVTTPATPATPDASAPGDVTPASGDGTAPLGPDGLPIIGLPPEASDTGAPPPAAPAPPETSAQGTAPATGLQPSGEPPPGNPSATTGLPRPEPGSSGGAVVPDTAPPAGQSAPAVPGGSPQVAPPAARG